MSDTDTSIVVTVDAALGDIVSDRMWQWGVRAVSETEVAPGRVEVATSVGNERDAIDRAVATLDPQWTVELRMVDTSISQAAPEFLKPTWYAPGCVSVPAALHPADGIAPDALVTVIDQGSAFGLGDHPTTSTSMAMLVNHLRNHSVERLLDVGCGTGALAVVAAQLGVPAVRGIDIADAAVEATLRNAELNDVRDAIDVSTTPLAAVTGTYDVVMANILAPTLIELADDLQRVVAPGGSLFISGILEARHDHVLTALEPLSPVESMPLDGWITIHLT